MRTTDHHFRVVVGKTGHDTVEFKRPAAALIYAVAVDAEYHGAYDVVVMRDEDVYVNLSDVTGDGLSYLADRVYQVVRGRRVAAYDAETGEYRLDKPTR